MLPPVPATQPSTLVQIKYQPRSFQQFLVFPDVGLSQVRPVVELACRNQSWNLSCESWVDCLNMKSVERSWDHISYPVNISTGAAHNTGSSKANRPYLKWWTSHPWFPYPYYSCSLHKFITHISFKHTVQSTYYFLLLPVLLLTRHKLHEGRVFIV